MADSVFKTSGINHVVLHVSNLQRSLDFYLGVLGFEQRNVGGGPNRPAAFLRCGMQGLDLFETDEGSHGGEEMNHMALNIDVAGIDEVMAALQAAGIASSDRTNRDTVFIEDPDGHRIEMLPLTASERQSEREAVQAAS